MLLRAFATLAVPILFLLPQDPAPAPTVQAEVVRRQVHGFDVRLVHGFDKHALHDHVMTLLADQLYQISRVVAEPALAKLRTIPIWVGFEDARHAGKCMFYHPSARWLETNDYPVELAGGVEIANANNFLSWTLDQPWMVLHELAHGFHHQVLGYDHVGIRAAFGAAKEAGLYEKVLRIGGSQEKHYALTNDQEYFAEASEAYFGTNDFYPYVRSELREYDARGYEVLEQVWGKRRR
jgi:hypothetical protein